MTFQSDHFMLETIAEGIYAAIHKDGAGAVGNAGIIDLGDRSLVFDTFLTPVAAEDLRRAAEELTGRNVTLVINSHYHNDHIWGNQVFEPTTEIIATQETNQLILTRGREDIKWYKENAEPELEKLIAKLGQEEEKGVRIA